MENNESPPAEPVLQLVPADPAKRLVNYLVDIIVFSFLLSFLLVLASPVYPLMQQIMAKQPITEKDQLIMIFVYGLYMSALEAVLKGKSVGKYITGTRAVTENGLPINSHTAFVRGLIRIVPFEQLSAIWIPSRPWHDRWSGSFVVDERRSILPKKQ